MSPLKTLVAIVPSARISARWFLSILADNGIQARIIGLGTAVVQSAMNRKKQVAGTLVIAIMSSDLSRAQAHGKLCGVTLTPLEIEGCISRANVV